VEGVIWYCTPYRDGLDIALYGVLVLPVCEGGNRVLIYVSVCIAASSIRIKHC
jgi:hypothetical protein